VGAQVFRGCPQRTRVSASKRLQITQVHADGLIFNQFPTIWRGQLGSIPYVFRTVWGLRKKWVIVGALTLTRKRTEKNLVHLRSLFEEICVWANGEQ
jgi:hypothetical protein